MFLKQSWDVVGQKQYKQQFLEHLYDVATNSIALPLPDDSLAVATFRLQLHRYIELSAQRLQLEKQAEKYLQERSDYQHLRTIPGIGPVIALMVIVESGNLTRFAHYRQYLNYCGFNLSAIQSGQKHSGYRVSKRGNARLRYSFWLAATVAVRTRENSFRYKYERYLRENGDKPDQKRKAMTAVATKVARVAHAIVKQNIDYKGYYGICHGTLFNGP